MKMTLMAMKDPSIPMVGENLRMMMDCLIEANNVSCYHDTSDYV